LISHRLMFEDVEATYNPIVGCLHGCVYCYARKIALKRFSTAWYYRGFKPNLVESRLKQPPPKGLIFISDMGDLQDPYWRAKILSSIAGRGKISRELTERWLKHVNQTTLTEFMNGGEDAWIGGLLSCS